MSTLQSELSRLYSSNEHIRAGFVDDEPSLAGPDGLVRAMVLELSRPADWKLLSSVWSGVQSELGLPAPAIAVNGADGYQLWFSVATPVPKDQAIAFLEALRVRYLNAVAPERLAMSPSRDEAISASIHHTGMVPTQRPATGLWSAFVAPDLAAIFAEEPWLDVAPSAEAQASILSGLKCMQPAGFQAVIANGRPTDGTQSTTDQSILANTQEHRLGLGAKQALASATGSSPKQFLLDVMNDTTMEIHHRIEAAKALLPYFESEAGL